MSDIKSVLVLLCKYLHLSIDSSFKPEYFRLAKYNKDNEEVTRALWTTLYNLSYHAVKDMQIDDNFDRYDDVYATKLFFAFLQYPTIEFYGLSPMDNTSNRELLVALSWLLATKNVSNIVLRAKLASSIFSQEYSRVDDTSSEIVENQSSLTDPRSLMNSIVSTCGRVGHNIKGIAELVTERIKLTTKIHGASLNTCGLPHLSAWEVGLAKKSFGKTKAVYTKKDEDCLRELNSLAEILDTYTQWTKKEHIFYDWMVTVIEENTKDEAKSSPTNRCDELSNFLSLLRHVIKKKLYSMKAIETKPQQTRIGEEYCVSRLQRTVHKGNEAEIWCSRINEELNMVEIEVDAKMKKLTAELEKMLKSIPNCVEI